MLHLTHTCKSLQLSVLNLHTSADLHRMLQSFAWCLSTYASKQLVCCGDSRNAEERFSEVHSQPTLRGAWQAMHTALDNVELGRRHDISRTL